MLLQREARSSVDDAIDLTSMVDVVFQLLIFLMITYQASSNAEVELPEAAHGIGVEENLATILTLVPAPVPGDPVLVYDGASTDESARLADDEAIAEAVRGGLSRGRRRVVLQADGAVPHGEVLRIMGAAAQVDGIRLHIGVEDPR